MREGTEGGIEHGARLGLGAGLLLALGVLALSAACANASSATATNTDATNVSSPGGSEPRVAARAEHEPEQVVQRMAPAPPNAPVASSAGVQPAVAPFAVAPFAVAPPAGSAPRGKRAAGEKITPKHIEAELNRLEAELK